MSGNDVVPGFGKFLEYMGPFSDRFIVIGGTAVMFIKDEGDVVLGMSGRATHDIDLMMVAEKVDAEFVTAFLKLVHDGEYEGYHDRDLHPHYYRFERAVKDGVFPVKLELLTKNPFPDNAEFRYASLTIGIDDYLSAMVLDPEYYQFALTHSRLSHGLRALSREGLIALKSQAAMNHLRDSRVETDDHKRGISYANYKKHRKDVFLLMAGVADEVQVETTQGIRQDLQAFYDEHRPGSAILTSAAQAFGSSDAVASNVMRAYFRMFKLTDGL